MRADAVASRLFPQVTAEYERRLPQAGEVLVEAGAWVTGDTIVARCRRQGALRVVDAAAALGIPQSRLERCLRVFVGDTVEPDQVLAANGLAGWRTVRSPVRGRVAQVVAGRILVQEQAEQCDLLAHMPGQVVRVLPNWGIVVRSTVARVLGVWGAGGECAGPLVLRSETPGEALQWIGIDLACRGKIVVGGLCLDRRVLLRAARFRALGLVVGGLAEHLRSRAQELGLVVLVTDGLGAVPMAAPVFELLRRHAGRRGLLVGGDATKREAPALSVPLEGVQSVATQSPRPLAVGDRVRLTGRPHLGASGLVRALHEQESACQVEVALDDGAVAMVAYRNLERLG